VTSEYYDVESRCYTAKAINVNDIDEFGEFNVPKIFSKAFGYW